MVSTQTRDIVENEPPARPFEAGGPRPDRLGDLRRPALC